MRTLVFSAVAIFLGACLCSQTVNASDCSGPWSILPNWDKRTAPCRQLGLDSKRGVCHNLDRCMKRCVMTRNAVGTGYVRAGSYAETAYLHRLKLFLPVPPGIMTEISPALPGI